MPKLPFSLQLSKIGPKEKLWIVVWVSIVLMSVYYRFQYQPRALKIKEAVRQINSLNRDKMTLRAKQPNIEKRKQDLAELKQQISTSYEQLSVAEQKLVDVQNIDALLDSLVKDRGKFELVLNSIRPVQQKEPSTMESSRNQKQIDPYRKLKIQLDVFSTFQGLVNYIAFLEQMRPYQEVEGLKVKVEGKEVSRPHAVFLISVLLGESSETKEIRRKEIFGLLEDVASREAKDPFLTAERPKEVVQAVGLELTGIFSEEGQPVAAMINNEIYRIGDVIDNKKVVNIEANRVLLERGNRRFVLTPSQQQKEAGQ